MKKRNPLFFLSFATLLIAGCGSDPESCGEGTPVNTPIESASCAAIINPIPQDGPQDGQKVVDGEPCSLRDTRPACFEDDSDEE